MDELSRFMKDVLSAGILSCHVCKKVMIVPVWLSQEEKNYCSVCYDKYTGSDKPTFFIRNVALETLLCNLPYPCENTDCQQVLFYPAYREHIARCSYSRLNCPISDCTWTGSKSSLLAHLAHIHTKQNLKELIFTIPYKETDSDDFTVLQTINGDFIARVKWTGRKLQIVIYYQGMFQDLEGSFCVEYRTDPQEVRSRKCGITSDLDCLLNLDTSTNVTELNFETVLREFPVHIVYRLKGNLSLMPDSTLNYYRCCDCKEYMKREIHECTEGHYFCKDCLDEHNCLFTNPRPSQYVRRNWMLLPIAQNFLFPCDYGKYGCPFYVSLNNRHEENCSYDYYMCPFGLDCTRLVSHRNILAHIRQEHKLRILGNGHCTDYPLDRLNTFAITFNDKVFALRSGPLTEGRYTWDVNELGKRTDEKYVFTVSIQKNRHRESFAITHVCGNTISIPREQIKPYFVSDTEVKCSITVRRNDVVYIVK